MAGFLKLRSSEEILEWTDTIPNNGFIRHLEMLNTEVIVLTEPKMIADFLGAKAYHFSKTPRLRRILEMLLGRGLITVEGGVHKVCYILCEKAKLRSPAPKKEYHPRFQCQGDSWNLPVLLDKSFRHDFTH